MGVRGRGVALLPVCVPALVPENYQPLTAMDRGQPPNSRKQKESDNEWLSPITNQEVTKGSHSSEVTWKYRHQSISRLASDRMAISKSTIVVANT